MRNHKLPAALLMSVLLGVTLTAAQTLDLTGEICQDGSAVIDPDGDGPLAPHTYCLMQGRLPENTALEMDDLDGLPPMAGDPGTVEDANVQAGLSANDPDLPFIPGYDYIDWDDLTLADTTAVQTVTTSASELADLAVTVTAGRPQQRVMLRTRMLVRE